MKWQRLGRSIDKCDLSTICGSAVDNIFAGGNDTVVHFNGKSWRRLKTPKLGSVSSMWTSGPKDAFAVTREGVIWHFDGRRWKKQLTAKNSTFVKVWGRGPNEVFASGSAGVLRYDGQNWQDDIFPGDKGPTYIVWGTATHLFALSDSLLWRLNGNRWTKNKGIVSYVSDLWAAAADKVFAVGGSSAVARFDGREWTKLSPPSDDTINAVAGSGPNDLFMVLGDERPAASGAIMHFDGKRWQTEAQVRYGPMRGVWVAPDGSVYAVGKNCTILKRLPSSR